MKNKLPELIALIPPAGGDGVQGPPEPCWFYNDTPDFSPKRTILCAACFQMPVATEGAICEGCPTVARRSKAKEQLAAFKASEREKRLQRQIDSEAALDNVAAGVIV